MSSLGALRTLAAVLSHIPEGVMAMSEDTHRAYKEAWEVLARGSEMPLREYHIDLALALVALVYTIPPKDEGNAAALLTLILAGIEAIAGAQALIHRLDRKQ